MGFLTKFFEIIGIRGIIIILLLLFIGAETLVIKSLRVKNNGLQDNIITLNTQISHLKDKIKDQNDAVDKAAKDKEDLDNRLKQNDGKIASLNKENAALKGKLEKSPLAVDCKAAMVELKSQSDIAIKNWNKK